MFSVVLNHRKKDNLRQSKVWGEKHETLQLSSPQFCFPHCVPASAGSVRVSGPGRGGGRACECWLLLDAGAGEGRRITEREGPK